MQDTIPEPEELAIQKNFLILHALEKRGMSHARLSRKSGMNLRWIADLEEGKIILTFAEAELIGKILHINPQHLYLYSLQLSKLHTSLQLQKQIENTNSNIVLPKENK